MNRIILGVSNLMVFGAFSVIVMMASNAEVPLTITELSLFTYIMVVVSICYLMVNYYIIEKTMNSVSFTVLAMLVLDLFMYVSFSVYIPCVAISVLLASVLTYRFGSRDESSHYIA